MDRADVFSFIEAGLYDSLGTRVRNSAVCLAVSVYQTFGLEAMQPLLAGLRKGKQDLLKQKFEESEMSPRESAAAEDGMSVAGQSNADWSMHVRDADLAVHGQGYAMGGVGSPNGGVHLPGQSLPQLPGSLYDMEEELFMDGILEDVGMVFAGADACSMGAPRHMLPSMVEHPYMSLEEIEEQCYLEQQLRELGIELEEGLEQLPFSPGSLDALPAVAPIVGVGGARQLVSEEDELAVLSCRSHSGGQGQPPGAAEEHSSSVLLEVF